MIICYHWFLGVAGLTRIPVTDEIMGSSPIGTASIDHCFDGLFFFLFFIISIIASVIVPSINKAIDISL